MPRKIKKKDLQKKVAKAVKHKMNMFDKLGDKCLSCEKPYEKDNPEFVKNWYVMVNEKHDKQVRLYCPECWTKANEIIEDFKKRVEERIEKGNL